MPTTILTDIAEAKLTQAAGTETQVAITHVALGDGNGASYDGDEAQTALRNEIIRKPIERRHIIDPTSWRIMVEFGPETEEIYVREMGFFDRDGDLIALSTFPEGKVRRTGAIIYRIEDVLKFSRELEGLIIVDAPDDDLFYHAVTNGITIANLQLEQLRQADRIRKEHGAY